MSLYLLKLKHSRDLISSKQNLTEMKIGMNMLLWTTYVDEQYYPVLDKIKATGYDGVEIPIGDGDRAYYKALGKRLKGLEFGVTCTSSLFEDCNPASPDATIRANALDQLKWRIDMAVELGAELIAGPFHSAFAHFSGEPPTQAERQWSAETLSKAAEYAQQANIILTPEYLNRFECYLYNTMDDISTLIDAVDHPNLKLIYDSHHAHIEEKDVASVIKKHAANIRHVHISENDRGTPGKGQVHWDATFRTLKEVGYDHWLSIEAFSRHNPTFASNINVWRNYQPTFDEIFVDGYSFIKEMWNKY